MRLPQAATAVVSALVLALIAGTGSAHANPTPAPTPVVVSAEATTASAAPVTPTETPATTPTDTPAPEPSIAPEPPAQTTPPVIETPTAAPTSAPAPTPTVIDTPSAAPLTPSDSPSPSVPDETPSPSPTPSESPKPMERIQGSTRAIGSTNLTTVDLVTSETPGVLYELPASTAPWFSLVGFTWDSFVGIAPHLSVRVRVNGEWAEWHEVDLDQAASAQGATDPIFVERADAVEVRVTGDAATRINNPQIILISSPEKASDATVKATTPVQRRVQPNAAVGYLPIPKMVLRDQWGAAPLEDGCDDPADTIKGVVVHHTAGSNTYTQAQAPSIVRGIQSYHASLGWCDVGYNFLVDKYGTAYEGRGGGLLLPVFGYHATSWNRNTLGISVMMNSGTSQSNKVTPSPAVIDAMASIIAWKLAGNYRDPNSTVTIAGKTTPIIFRHGDVMATACPGVGITEQMGALRALVTTKMANATPSAIAKFWTAEGGENSYLGSVREMEHASGSGRAAGFVNGFVTQSNYGIFGTNGSIGNLYQVTGADDGYLGFIAGKMVTITDGWAQDFSNGRITSTPAGTYAVSGGIYWAWKDTGLEAGRVGKPIGVMTTESYGWRQNFDKGYIVFENGVGTKVLDYPSSAVSATPLTPFLQSVVGPAQRAQTIHKVPASVSLAQAMLESGSGTSELARYAHAYFGIKCRTSNQYSSRCYDKVSKEYLNGQWVDVKSPFRAYNSADDSFLDHGLFLAENSRYAPAFRTTTANDFARAIAAAGYATDPSYANKLIELMSRYDLYRFDNLITTTTSQPVIGPIGTKYAALGGTSGVLGYSIGGEYKQSSTVQTVSFNKGMIIWSQATGASAMTAGPIWDAYRYDASLRSSVGLPKSDVKTVTGGVTQDFVAGVIVARTGQAAIPVGGALADAYRSTGLTGGQLGFPTAWSKAGPNGGWYQTFDKGRLSLTAKYGAIPTTGAIHEAYVKTGAEAGYLGYPTGWVQKGPNGGLYQTFEGGRLSWHPDFGAIPTSGGLGESYRQTGAESGYLEYPKGWMTQGPNGGWYQVFQTGRLSWHPTLGTIPTSGAIGHHYLLTGGEAGYLGYPNDWMKQGPNGGWYQTFVSGRLSWHPTLGTIPTSGAIGHYYLVTGGEAGYLGYPTDWMKQGPRDGWYQTFVSGRLSWHPSYGVIPTSGSLGAAYVARGAEAGSLGYPINWMRNENGVWVQDFERGRIAVGPGGIQVSPR